MSTDHRVKTELAAWRLWCYQASELGIDVNAPNSQLLVAAVRVWGESLAMLRRQQTKGEHVEETGENCVSGRFVNCKSYAVGLMKY